jgi:predicted phosphodiesterase
MKLLILSDTHFATQFNLKQYHKLHSAISAADEVIINGDFWDWYLTEFDKFLNSPWKQLFPLLLRKNTTYIYGNHDLSKYADERVKLFSKTQTDFVEIEVHGKKLRIEHGHRLVPGHKLPKIFSTALTYIQWFMLRSRFLTSILDLERSRWNRIMKQWAMENLTDEILICGHSHKQELALESKFINTGFNFSGYLQYLWVTEAGFELVNEKY